MLVCKILMLNKYNNYWIVHKCDNSFFYFFFIIKCLKRLKEMRKAERRQWVMLVLSMVLKAYWHLKLTPFGDDHPSDILLLLFFLFFSFSQQNSLSPMFPCSSSVSQLLWDLSSQRAEIILLLATMNRERHRQRGNAPSWNLSEELYQRPASNFLSTFPRFFRNSQLFTCRHRVFTWGWNAIHLSLFVNDLVSAKQRELPGEQLLCILIRPSSHLSCAVAAFWKFSIWQHLCFFFFSYYFFGQAGNKCLYLRMKCLHKHQN